MKKGFVSIFALLILLTLSISLAFINEQARNKLEIKENILDKKQASYDAESSINIFLKENKDKLLTYIDKDFARDISSTKDEDEVANLKEETISYKDKARRINITRVKGFYGTAKDDRIYKVSNESIYKSSMGEARAYIDVKINPILNKENHANYQENKDYFDELKLKDVRYIENKNLKNKEKSMYEGVVIANESLKLKYDLEVEGILIVKGDIDLNGNKLIVKGLLICDSVEDKNLSYANDYKVYKKYFNDLENLYTLQIISKQAY